MNNTRKEIRDWLQAELQKRGHGAKGKLAEFLGIRPDGVTRMLNEGTGKEVREIKAEELAKMSEFFRTAPPITGAIDLVETDIRPEYVKILGKVAANTWMDVDDMDFSYDDIVEVPVIGHLPSALQFGLVVDGNCLNKIANNGDILVCLDLKRSGESFREDDLVVVERRRYGGQMVQRTAKRVKTTTNGYELWPESTDPAHQEPIRLFAADTGEDVEIIGKVLWIMRKP